MFRGPESGLPILRPLGTRIPHPRSMEACLCIAAKAGRSFPLWVISDKDDRSR